MSKSFKKTPIVKCSSSNWRRFAKKEANKSVRRNKEIIPKGKAYRKIYNSFDIDDYVFYMPYDIKGSLFYDSKEKWEKVYKRK